ncbi:MAG TPA: zinc-dependent peptidase, partial [Desulfurivibrionaceae bacterium]|nr:zinc-dependent peptidase [Desulfurivibrionaceae bacterium]
LLIGLGHGLLPVPGLWTTEGRGAVGGAVQVIQLMGELVKDDVMEPVWLDPYGATEPAEFFAVLTEAFFQQPDPLAQAQPEVFRALCGFYRLDPRNFSAYPADRPMASASPH